MDDVRVVFTDAEAEYIVGLISDDYLKAFGVEDTHAMAIRLMLIKDIKTKLLTAIRDASLRTPYEDNDE
jgi:hypothetical protein